MQLFVMVLNRTEYLDEIFSRMLEKKIGGATALDSTGMMRVLDGDDVDFPMTGILRQLFNPERRQSKTFFCVLKDEQIPEMMDIINSVTGGLHTPDSGVAFALPLSFVEGVEKKR